MAQLGFFLSSFVYWKHLAGVTALDCWFERQLEWERWLVGCSLIQKPAGHQETAGFPTIREPLGCRFRK